MPAKRTEGHEEYFWSRVDKVGDCWTWTGAKGGTGYGSLTFKGRPTSAHRVAYEISFGPIPGGMFVCHHCDNRLCCNPAHLFLGTTTDNMRDMSAKGRGEKAKTHCPKGHEYTAENTRVYQGRRNCRACAREAQRAKAHTAEGRQQNAERQRARYYRVRGRAYENTALGEGE